MKLMSPSIWMTYWSLNLYSSIMISRRWLHSIEMRDAKRKEGVKGKCKFTLLGLMRMSRFQPVSFDAARDAPPSDTDLSSKHKQWMIVIHPNVHGSLTLLRRGSSVS